jgi:hypothetical protein
MAWPTIAHAIPQSRAGCGKSKAKPRRDLVSNLGPEALAPKFHQSFIKPADQRPADHAAFKGQALKAKP